MFIMEGSQFCFPMLLQQEQLALVFMIAQGPLWYTTVLDNCNPSHSLWTRHASLEAFPGSESKHPLSKAFRVILQRGSSNWFFLKSFLESLGGPHLLFE